jgi:AAA+ ATPase superfamily predicted ATPase
MVCWHCRHDLGDKHKYRDPDDFWFYMIEKISGSTDRADQMTLEQQKKYIKENVIILPLYLYDHTIQSISTSSFIGRAHHAEWDSGQVGWIYAEKKKIREEYKIKRITKEVRDRVIAALKAEVEEYSHWIEGEVYGYVLNDANDNKIDSCWGFIGTDWENNGMADQIPDEYHYLLKKVA